MTDYLALAEEQDRLGYEYIAAALREAQAEIELLKRLHDGHREVLGVAREEVERLRALLLRALLRAVRPSVACNLPATDDLIARIDAELKR